MAVNCWVWPLGTLADCGVIAIETSDAAVTVRTVEPVTDPEVALMVAVPVAMLVARPVLLTVATVVVSELHCTVFVMFCMVPLVNAPVAVNCCVVPNGMLGIAGVTAIETKAADVTFSVVEPVTDPDVAVAVVLPTATLVASPWAFTVAML